MCKWLVGSTSSAETKQTSLTLDQNAHACSESSEAPQPALLLAVEGQQQDIGAANPLQTQD